ncbi:MAG TPA: hypothetical protein VGX51_09435 [Solirubrobacteraceae bacterium]|nr:hypothetical protein [Solirubrobacteraceae bacterium]
MTSTSAHEIEERLRASRPEPAASPPSLSWLRALIDRAESGATPSHPEPRHRWRGRRAVAPAIVAVMVLGGAASGALLIATGRPLPPASVLPANPETGLGQPLADSVAPVPIRAPDPEGGPAWGMRVLRTTRGLVCLQGGRIVNGQLGGLGTGYAFGADGRFHPFLPADAIATDACPAVGSRAPAFLPGPPVIVTANALPLAGENVAPGDQVHCDLPGQSDWGVRCPQSELREVAMGLLGPAVAAIEVSAPSGSFTVRPYGPDGAYLIVLPPPRDANASMSAGAWQSPFGYASNAPGGAVLEVVYGDGSHCQIPPSTPQLQCRARSSREVPLPSFAGLSADVQVSYVPRSSHPVWPLLAWARSSTPTTQKAFEPSGGQEGAGPALSVSFRAPVAAPNASTAYAVELHPKEVAGCATPAVIVSQPSQRTIAAGERVQMMVPLEDRCATSYSGRVFFAKSAGIGGESGGEGPLYEAIAAQFGGGAQANPMKFPTVGRFQLAVP